MRGKRLTALAIAIASSAFFFAACAAEQASKEPATAPHDVTPSSVGQPPGVDQDGVRTRARNDIKQAEIELEAAGSDCSRACKALASMERATAHLCSAVATPDDQRSCDDAQQKLKSSRDRVRGACGECQH